jgi:hypothetical protein
MLVSTLATCLLAAHAQPVADEIKALPGWDAPLPSKQYSG